MTRARSGIPALAALAACLLAWAACGGTSISAKPSPETIETAESVSRSVTIVAPVSSTPESDDQGKPDAMLDAHIFGSGGTGVILVHMRPADQTSWFAFATRLAATGRFTALTFDFRGFGASPGEKEFDRIDTDLEAVYQYMTRTMKLSRVFLVGASMGGTASLAVGARESVAGIVSISSPAQFENLDATQAVASITAPKLFITSKDDVPAERSLRELADAAPPPKDEEIYDGDAHGTNIFDGPHAEDLTRRLIDFLSNH